MEIAEIKLSYSSGITEFERVYDSASMYGVLLLKWDLDTIELQEEFKVVFLNNGNGIIGIYNHSKGSSASTVVDTRIICSVALKCNATYMVLAHNHPSDNLKPSKTDIKLTEKLKEAAKLFDIHVIDHLIISKNGYYSFSEAGFV